MTAWRRDQTRDRFFQQAKKEGYRARSAYKLAEIDRRCHLLKNGSRVLDIGAAPGSWSQYAIERIRPDGRVVAVDLTPIGPIAGVTAITGDIREPGTLVQARSLLDGPADVVLSDVSPRVSGNRVTDQARSIELAEASLAAAQALARPGSHFVVKVFRGDGFDDLVACVKATYRSCRVVVPEATRGESREAYVVGLELRTF